MIDHTCRIVWCVHDHCLGLFVDLFLKFNEIRLEIHRIRRYNHQLAVIVADIGTYSTKYGAKVMTCSPGFNRVFKMTFKPLAAPTVIRMLPA